ncbi:Neurofilament medium polypeptide [Triplophysa tibetana]|uniref:Neurofilament medium polypeptide n=1 Tax=Triplophysa tibetana TaxID=1572043 RepID=A0A5A9NXP6_9TELE|nr:Neurofilament medium polypeptide [Triplophysa tibetana]
MSSRRRTLETRTTRPTSTPMRSHSWAISSPGSSMHFKKTSSVPVSRSYTAALASPDGFELSAALNGDPTRTNEKEQLQGLNDRFASYIDKVRFLEEQNNQLEAEIQALKQQKLTQSLHSDAYDRELGDLRCALEQLHKEKVRVLLDTEHIDEDLHRLRERYEDEARLRENVEAAIRDSKKDKDDSNLMKLELERKVKALADEIDFLRQNHEEEINELLAQLQAAQVPVVETRDLQKTDITSALREIRAQLDGLSSKNLQQAEEVFKCRYSMLTNAADQNKGAIKSIRDEIADYRRQIQGKNIELEALRGTKESLERQLHDIEDSHNTDVGSYQEMMHQLENDLKATKWEMARHLREYQDLLNVKMALDAEIAAYRKLLEGEETRFHTISGSITSPSFAYSQPKTSKVKHKIVEEIIEETKGEIDIDDDLAEVAQELGEEADEEKEEEAEEEEVIVAAKQAKVSSAAPEDEEGGDEEETAEEEGEVEDEEGEEAAEEGEEEEEEPKVEVIDETELCGDKTPTSDKEEKEGSDKEEGEKKEDEEEKEIEESEEKAKDVEEKEETDEKDEEKDDEKEETKPEGDEEKSDSKAEETKTDSGKDEVKPDTEEEKKTSSPVCEKKETEEKTQPKEKEEVVSNGDQTSPAKEEPSPKEEVLTGTVDTTTNEDKETAKPDIEKEEKTEEKPQDKKNVTKKVEKETSPVKKEIKGKD